MTSVNGKTDLQTAAEAGEGGDEEVFVFPLSPQQKRFWHADRKLPGNPAYNGAFRHELSGGIDIVALEAAFNDLIDRHEVLRAVCREIEGEVRLVIAPEKRIRLKLRDLRHLPEAERESRMEALCEADARFRFDLETGPLIRVGLIRLADDMSVLTLTLHHMVCDGWSVSLLMDELPLLYAAHTEGRPSGLKPLEIQYGDFATWLEDHLESAEIREQTAYWRRKLSDYRRLDVTSDLERPAGACLDADIVSRELAPDLIEALKAFTDTQGGTLFMTSLAALTALLRRMTGRRDISIGTPVAGRSRRETEMIVGPLLNYVVLSTQVIGNPTLAALEEAVRDTVLDAFANQDVPMEHVAAALDAGGGSADPFYSVSFVSQRAFAGGSRFTFDRAGLKMRTLPSKSQGALYDLFFFLVERENGWRLSLEYRTGLFSRQYAEGMLGDLISVMVAMTERAEARIGDLELASCIASTTDALADDPDCDGVSLLPASFAQERFWLLNRAAPANPAFNMPIALRIDGALDADLLEASLRTVIDRHESLRTTFVEQDGALCQVIAPQTEFLLARRSVADVALDGREAALDAVIRSEAAAPFDLERGPLIRGVLIEMERDRSVLAVTLHHIVSDGQSIGNLQGEMWQVYQAGLAHGAPALEALPIQYGDFSAWQRDWVKTSEAELQRRFWTQKLAGPLPVLDFPLDRPPAFRPASTGAIATRPLNADMVAGLKALALAESSTIFAVTSAAFALLLSRCCGSEDVLFGCPMANRSVETQKLLGPFAGPMAVRLNLEGDPTLRDVIHRARDDIFTSLGNTEYPFELLLDDIDARSVGGRNPLFQFYFLYQKAFLRERSVGGLAVRPIPSLGVGTPYELQLGLIERAEGVTAQLEYNPELLDRATIEKVLDAYFSVIDRMLRDPDCRASELPMPDLGTARPLASLEQARPQPVHVEPSSDLQKQLAGIWSRVLGIQTVGITDDFFAIGGQSLLAARLISEVEKAFGTRLDLSVLAVDRTIEQLARRLSGADGQDVSRHLIALQPKGDRRPLFCIHGGGGHVLHYQDLAAAVSREQPIYGLSAPELDGAARSPEVADLAALYIEEMKKVQPHGPYNICGYSFGGIVAYEMAAQLEASGETTDALVILDTANRAYYRNMPPAARMQYWGTILSSRGQRYVERIRRGRWGELVWSIGYFVHRHWTRLWWRVGENARQARNAALPARIQDSVVVFDAAADRYVPTAFNGRVLLLRAASREPEYNHNPSLGWEQVARGGVDVQTVPGDHLTMVKSPNVGILIGHIEAHMARGGDARGS